MQNISSTINLKEAIRIIEIEQAANGQLLRAQFHLTYESLKPVSILKSTLKDISSSPIVLADVIGTGLGLVSGYLSKKIVVGASANIFRKLLGTIVQIGVANTVAKHPDAINSIGEIILQYFMHKKEKKSTKE